MLHPRLTAVGSSTPIWLASIGPYGAWSDLEFTTRWGEGACGMFEAQFKMPLPPGFEHPLLRRGTLVELMNGPYRVGSPLILTEPSRGSGLADPWQFTAIGIGREVEGENSFYALDSSNRATVVPSTAVDNAITRPGSIPGWRIAGRDSSIPTAAVGSTVAEQLVSVGSLLSSASTAVSKRWGVDDDNLVKFYSDPTTPTWTTTPNVASLGVADDDYATIVIGTYSNSAASGAYATVVAPASVSATETTFGRREYPADLTPLGPMTAATAQGYVDGILAKSKGRLGWTNGLTLTSNELLNMGGVPAPLSLVKAGQMLRIHGIFNDLLSYNGQTWLDIIIGETKYTDGAQTIDINPLGLAARDLAKIIEEVTGTAGAA